MFIYGILGCIATLARGSLLLLTE